MTKRKVVIAPDSFKGTIDAAAAAVAIGAGWRRVRPGDDVSVLPQADGGEGTLAALASADPRASWRDAGRVQGPDGRPVPGRWLRLVDNRAVVELAVVSGLPLMRSLDPLRANTFGLGEVLRAVVDSRPTEILVGLGGSASTDGGAGLLSALGARLLDLDERPLALGGDALVRLARLDLSGLVRTGPLVALTDVTAPLLGPDGAASVFGPQKGARPADVARLERGLARLAEVVGVDPAQPGLGAAGGTAYALAAVLGARIEMGAPFIADATGLAAAARDADVLITGEGRWDATSGRGKAVGHALGLRGPGHRVVIAGQVDPAHPDPAHLDTAHPDTGRVPPGHRETEPADCHAYSLSLLAGSALAAMTEPARWLSEAGARAAVRLTAELA